MAWRPGLAVGDYNLAVRAMQRGLHRALVRMGVKPLNKANGAYGKYTVVDIIAFKRHYHLVSPPHGKVNPNIFGSSAWDVIEPFLIPLERKWIAKYHAQVLAKEKEAAYNRSEQGRRAHIVGAATRAWNNRALYVYDQIRPMASNLFSPAAYHRTDCSSFATLCYKAAGAADPNHRGYDGYGFTGTLWPHGWRVQTPSPGDLAFYGWTSRFYCPSHVAVYVGNDQVISFGSTPIRKTNLRYRGDYMGCRSYF